MIGNEILIGKHFKKQTLAVLLFTGNVNFLASLYFIHLGMSSRVLNKSMFHTTGSQ